jgi:ethanolamine utilization protein EutP (predicted NTPase)
MKYESDIAEMIHEMAIEKFKIGIISEADMREYDEMCLTPEALQETAAQGNNAKGNIAHETVNIEHADLAIA